MRCGTLRSQAWASAVATSDQGWVSEHRCTHDNKPTAKQHSDHSSEQEPDRKFRPHAAYSPLILPQACRPPMHQQLAS